METRYAFDPSPRRKITTGFADPTAPVNPARQNAPGANDAFFAKARAARAKPANGNPEGLVGGEEYSASDAVASIKANDPTAVATQNASGMRQIKGKYGTASIATPEQSLVQRDADLRARHPAIWEKDSPENRAFVAHAKQFGTDSAMQNVDNLMKVASVGRVAQPDPGKVAANLARKAAAMGTGNPNPTSYPVPTKPSSTPSAETRDPTAGQVGAEFAGEFKKRAGGVFRNVAEATMGAGRKVAEFVRGAAGTPAAVPSAAPRVADFTQPEPDPRKRRAMIAPGF